MSKLIKGIVVEVSDEITFNTADKETGEPKLARYREVLFNTGEGKLLLTHLHTNTQKEIPEVGELYEFQINVVSKRNNKNPKVFFHKVKLVYYSKIINQQRIEPQYTW